MAVASYKTSPPSFPYVDCLTLTELDSSPDYLPIHTFYTILFLYRIDS